MNLLDRFSISGRYVTKKTARCHPRTTVKSTAELDREINEALAKTT